MSERVPVPEEFGLTSHVREPHGPSTDAARRLTHLLQAHAPVNERPTSDVREAICDFVDELKGAGVPPERVLVQMKAVVAASQSGRRAEESDEERQFLQQLISWCIEEYYRTR